MVKNKKAFEMNFAWIFAIIVGALILFLAIYATSKFIGVRRYEIDTQTAAKLSILLDPLETSLEAGKSSRIGFAQETRIYNKCYDYGNFGKHSISLSSKSGVGKEWQEPGGDIQIYNKYIFSEDIEQGKDFFVFSKPFNSPFKVSDLIFLSAKKYCFISAPNEIKDDIESLNLKNIQITDIKSNCSQESEKVCFSSSSDCDIIVQSDFDYQSGIVSKKGKIMYYTGPLLYGAIFSSPEIYECNVKRLMLRLVNLCLIYQDKISIVEKKGCNSIAESELSSLISLARELNSSQQLFLIQNKAQDIEEINDAAICKIW